MCPKEKQMNKETKKTIADIAILLTMVFKLFIFAATIITLDAVYPKFVVWPVTIAGIFWVLGMHNINTLISIFEK